MKHLCIIFVIIVIFTASCVTQQKLAYLDNLTESDSDGTFTMEIPDYRIQYRDILYITIKAMTPDGTITDFLSSTNRAEGSYNQSEAGQYIYGYGVDTEGTILLPVLGSLKIAGSTIEEARLIIQKASDKHFNNATVECKLLSFKFTVLGEVRTPGTYVNYNNYLNVLEAIGRAGGINDYGRRDKILVVRPVPGGTRTHVLNLQDKAILTSEAYFLLPNDVVIVKPESKKIFNLNLPAFTFIVTTATSLVTSTLLLINFLKK